MTLAPRERPQSVPPSWWLWVGVAIVCTAVVWWLKQEATQTELPLRGVAYTPSEPFEFWPWTFHGLVLFAATEFLVSGPRRASGPGGSLLRLAIPRAMVFAVAVPLLLAVSRVLGGAWVDWVLRDVLFGIIVGVGIGIASVFESLARRRAPSPGRDLLAAVITTLIALAWFTYAYVQSAHLDALIDGRASFKAALDNIEDLVTKPGRTVVVFLAFAAPVGITTLGRMRGLRLAPLLGLSVAGTCALSGLLLGGPFMTGSRATTPLMTACLLSLLLPPVCAGIDRLADRRKKARSPTDG